MTRRVLIYLLIILPSSLGCFLRASAQSGGGQPANPQFPSFRRPMTVDLQSFLYNVSNTISGNDLLGGGFVGANITTSGLTRFSRDGGVRWSIFMSAKDKPSIISAEVTAVDEMQNGDILAAGYHTAGKSSTVYHNYQDGYVARLNAKGEPRWMKIIDHKKGQCTIDNSFLPFLVSEGPDGEIIVAAEASNCVSGLKNLLLVKLDKDGNLIWYSSYAYSLSHAFREGLFFLNGKIVFWNFNGEGGSTLEMLQFNNKNGALENVKDWQIAQSSTSSATIQDGFGLKARQLDDGNFMVCLTTGNKANNVFDGDVVSTPLNLFVLYFDPSFRFLKGYDVAPGTTEKGTVQMNFSADGKGVVICNRLYLDKRSSNRYVNAIGAFDDGQIVHKRKFPNLNASGDVQEPLSVFGDGTFAYVNIFGSNLDFYELSVDDVDNGCLGVTPVYEELFRTVPVSLEEVSKGTPNIYADTVVIKPSDVSWGAVDYVKGNRLSIGPDQLICVNGSLTLKATLGFKSYEWSDGGTFPSDLITSPGRYVCNATDVCDVVYSDTVIITQMESLDPLPEHDTTVCRLDSVHIAAEMGYRVYQWSPSYNMVSEPGDRTLIAHPDHDTKYYLQAELYPGCRFFDTVLVKVKNSPVPGLGPDRSICNGDSISLHTGEEFSSYTWSTGSHSRSITVRKPGYYIVMIANADGCRAYDTVVVKPGACGVLFHMPNVFTPNGDGLNDQIRPMLNGFPMAYQFHIYNRWGKLIFRSETPGEGWDGRINGVMQPSETYTWQCIVQVDGSPPEYHKGTFTLIR